MSIPKVSQLLDTVNDDINFKKSYTGPIAHFVKSWQLLGKIDDNRQRKFVIGLAYRS